MHYLLVHYNLMEWKRREDSYFNMNYIASTKKYRSKERLYCNQSLEHRLMRACPRQCTHRSLVHSFLLFWPMLFRTLVPRSMISHLLIERKQFEYIQAGYLFKKYPLYCIHKDYHQQQLPTAFLSPKI